MSREEILRVDVPPGSRSKGYKSCHVRELIVTAELVHYRRECWILPNGKTVLAPLPQGIVGGYGPNLRRFCLMLHAQGQVTMDYDDLDKLLARLCRRKDELLKVLERPGTPLHTNASENDLRSFVTKRKISGDTMSGDGRVARDTMLGLMKTCRKLGPSFWRHLGDRLGLADKAIPPLTTLVVTKA